MRERRRPSDLGTLRARAAMRVMWLVACVSSVSACTKSEAAVASAACCTNEATAEVAATSPAAVSGSSARLPDLGPGDVRVRGRVGREGVELSVQNHAAVSVKLKAAVRVEHHASDRWVPVVASGLALRMSCEAAVTPCVSLVPGAELLPPAWPAAQGRGQCGECAECPAIEAGEYRFVVEACEGNGTSASDAFTIGDARSR